MNSSYQFFYNREELEKEFGNPRKCLLASAIATVISKTFGVRPLAPQSSLNRCPTFISKGKSFKSKLIGRNYRKVSFDFFIMDISPPPTHHHPRSL